jgi:hypothetical protein
VSLAALAASGTRAFAIVPEVAEIIFLALAVTAFPGDLTLPLLIHGRKTAPWTGGPRWRIRRGRDRLFATGFVIMGVKIIVRHADSPRALRGL